MPEDCNAMLEIIDEFPRIYFRDVVKSRMLGLLNSSILKTISSFVIQPMLLTTMYENDARLVRVSG